MSAQTPADVLREALAAATSLRLDSLMVRFLAGYLTQQDVIDSVTRRIDGVVEAASAVLAALDAAEQKADERLSLIADLSRTAGRVARIQLDFVDDLPDREGNIYEQVQWLIEQAYASDERAKAAEQQVTSLTEERDRLREDIAAWPVCEGHKPGRWDGGAHCVVCEAHEAVEDAEQARAELTRRDKQTCETCQHEERAWATPCCRLTRRSDGVHVTTTIVPCSVLSNRCGAWAPRLPQEQA